MRYEVQVFIQVEADCPDDAYQQLTKGLSAFGSYDIEDAREMDDGVPS
jgi:hypothetical protein